MTAILEAQVPYDNSVLREAISDHFMERFKTLRSHFLSPQCGQRYSDKHMHAMTKRLDECVQRNFMFEQRAHDDGSNLSFCPQWKNFIIHLLAVRSKSVNNCSFFFDYQKNTEYLVNSKDITMKLRTDYFKDTLVDWILILLSISCYRVVVFLPNDVSVISYHRAVREALSYQSTQPHQIDRLLHSVLEVTPSCKIPMEAKVVFMSCKTLCRLFVAREHKELDKCDLFLVNSPD